MSCGLLSEAMFRLQLTVWFSGAKPNFPGIPDSPAALSSVAKLVYVTVLGC